LCGLLVTGQVTCFDRKDRYFAATFDTSSLASMNRANTTYLLIFSDGSFEGTADGKSMSCQSTAVRTEVRFRRDSKYYTPPWVAIIIRALPISGIRSSTAAKARGRRSTWA
jgi:hypothetical protein